MKKICLVIGSFNRKNLVIEEIHSILKSNFNDFDLLVVDNASTDGTTDYIRKIFNNEDIKIIENKENMGAGNAFNTGIKYAYEKGYEYVMTLDHDVLIYPDTIGILNELLDRNSDAAIAFATYSSEDGPVQLSSLSGSKYNPEKMEIESHEYFTSPDNPIDFIYTDTFIAGVALIRISILKEVGLFKESYFIYHEDSDLGLRIIKAGYKIIRSLKSQYLHKCRVEGRLINSQDFSYYYIRNELNMFATHIDESQIEAFCNKKIEELFQAIYSCHLSKKYNVAKRLIFAYDDALNYKMGKVDHNYNFVNDTIESKISQLFKKTRNILVYENGKSIVLEKLLNYLFGNGDFNVTIMTDENTNQSIANQFTDKQVTFEVDTKNIRSEDFDIILELCDHIFNVEHFTKRIYIDRILNVAITDEDKVYCSKFKKRYRPFYFYQYPIFIEKIKKLRKNDQIPTL